MERAVWSGICETMEAENDTKKRTRMDDHMFFPASLMLSEMELKADLPSRMNTGANMNTEESMMPGTMNSSVPMSNSGTEMMA